MPTFFKEGRFTGLGTASLPTGATVVDRGLCNQHLGVKRKVCQVGSLR